MLIPLSTSLQITFAQCCVWRSVFALPPPIYKIIYLIKKNTFFYESRTLDLQLSIFFLVYIVSTPVVLHTFVVF